MSSSPPFQHFPQGDSQPRGYRYTQYLPRAIPLPTTWTPTELALLTGTSLSAAIGAKSRSLVAELDAFRNATAELAWARKAWWGGDVLTLDNWIHADALYRSRSLELPGHGAAMVPILDFANHADAEKANAYFEIDGEDVVLHLRPGKEWMDGEEVCIDYSDSAKSAAEFVFAYGFIPAGMRSAGGMLLPLQCSEDDPLGCAKDMVWAPAFSRGVKISETSGAGDKVEWESEWVYLVVANEEDGLEFQVLQMNDGERQLQVLLDGEELDLATRPGRVKELLERKEMWKIFELRAVATVKAAVDDALSRLLGGRHALEEEEGIECRPQMWSVGTRLRELEETLLLKAAETLAEEVSSTPTRYLHSHRSPPLTVTSKTLSWSIPKCKRTSPNKGNGNLRNPGARMVPWMRAGRSICLNMIFTLSGQSPTYAFVGYSVLACDQFLIMSSLTQRARIGGRERIILSEGLEKP